MGGVGTISSGSIASAEQQYALRWNDFHSSILSSFRHLRDEEDFIDVTIACDGCSFTAHKVVLSACSPFFRSLLKANPCQHPIVILRDVREQDMEALLRFMYNGEVHIGQEQMSDFLKTAQTLQVRGLADVSTKDSGKSSTGTTATSGITNNIPWDVDGTHNTSNNNNLDTQGPPLKKSRTTDHHHNSRYTDASPHVNASNDNDAQGQHPLNDTTMTLSERSHSTSNQVKGLDGPIQLHSSNDDDSNSFDDEPSDTECTDRGGSSIDLMQPKLEHSDYSYSERSRNDSILSPMFDPQRQRTGYASGLFNLQGIAAGLIPGPSGLHNNSQEAYGKVRATDPRPCPKCGKIYRSAHTLRTHLEDKHTICPGYRCVLCGTVAKSRNSLHSHMSRQHRGISTKDLPVLPMPSSFDPELASKLYMKAGIKMSPAELRARASPTGTVTPLRRSDTRLDMSSGSNNISGEDDPQDLSINSNRYGLAPPSPLDFHRNSPNLSKLNSIASMIPLLGSDKENRAVPPTTAMLDAYFHLLADGNLVTPEQAAEMSKFAVQNKWADYNNSGNNNGDNECSTSQDEDSFSEDETTKPIKASENY